MPSENVRPDPSGKREAFQAVGRTKWCEVMRWREARRLDSRPGTPGVPNWESLFLDTVPRSTRSVCAQKFCRPVTP